MNDKNDHYHYHHSINKDDDNDSNGDDEIMYEVQYLESNDKN